MKRLTLAIAFAASLAASPALADVQLRTNVLVDGDVVKLSDLFDNLGDKADTPVARAPAPGRRVTVDAEWLGRVARNYGVAWKPSSNFDQAVVERSGVTIGRDQIEQELRTALAAENIGPNSEIELTNRAAEVVVPVGSQTNIGVHDLVYDKHYNRFTATLEIPANTASSQRLRVSGRVFSVIDVPVLNRAVNRGEVIGAHDLNFVRMREDTVRHDVLTDADQLIGLSPKQPLRSGQMVGNNELQKPVVVPRGALVTMVLKFGTMTLTAQGRANEPGAMGDTIRVANTQSNQVVEAKVDGPNLVSIAPNGASVLAN